MAILKCKMCGGTLEFEPGATVGVCDSCGTKQTLPRLDSDKKANLYDRASHFRRNNDFDKAISIYEQILAEDGTDAEAYWSLVLCRYGIEYVEEPETGRRIPTVNRAQLTSVFADADYKSAIEHADGAQREIYEAEARAIEDIQKGILEISSREEPFDVFICYKETDSFGKRTPDSVLANDLYHQLTQEGFKVFFARITLEDKLGTEYEPYIFAALQSAKVMVVLGTKSEYFNAPWVKNEWSRYLALVKNSGGKMLIPAYKDMDPYDLPEEFSHLQAQDMSRLGFMQDLIRGIRKIVQAGQPNRPEEREDEADEATAPLLRRMFLFLEDGDWEAANTYAEKVLDQDPENATAYVGKLMAAVHAKKQEELTNASAPIQESKIYEKIMRFGDDALRATMEAYNVQIEERIEMARKQEAYAAAQEAMEKAGSERSFREVAASFQAISGFAGADALAEQCLEKAEEIRKNTIYDKADRMMGIARSNSCKEALEIFRTISGWRDVDARIEDGQSRLAELEAKEEAERMAAIRRARRKTILWVTVVVVIVMAAAAGLVWRLAIVPAQKYAQAQELLAKGEYEEAYAQFDALNGYADSTEQALAILMVRPYVEGEGAVVTLGQYEQDGIAENGTEPIQWIVLDKQEDRYLLISKYALESMRFTENGDADSVTWETSTLRTWLNGTFYSAAFNEWEQNKILQTTVPAHRNTGWSSDPGADTQDKLFLLSMVECQQYWPADWQRQCMPTAHTGAQNELMYAKKGCGWWLRTPGIDEDYAAVVNSDGSIGDYGAIVVSKSRQEDDDFPEKGVRPAMWVNFDA